MKQFIAQKWLPGLLLASIAYVLCFPEYNWPVFSFLVMPGLLWTLPRLGNRRQALAAGLVISTIISLGGFSWIAYTIQNFGGFPWAIAALFLVGYCLVAAPQMYVFFLLAQRYQNRISVWPGYVQAICWSVLYVALEFIARHIKIFPEHLGNTLIAWLPIAQHAAWGGVSVLSLIPLLIGGLLYIAISQRSRGSIIAAGVAALCFSLLWITGEKALKDLEALVPSETIKLSLIQANIGDIEKIVSEAGDKKAVAKVLDRYLTQSEAAARAGTDLIVWPETAYPLTFPSSPNALVSKTGALYAKNFRDRLLSFNTPILFGGYERIGDHDYNSLILLNGNGQWLASYRKVMLLIFGEYMPLGEWFPALKNLNPMMGDFARGIGPVPIVWTRAGKAPISIGANICYEAIMPEYMQGLAANGAQLFVNATNDSWFGPKQEPWQHLQLAQLRSIENRIPAVRATNTGVSTAISLTGRTLTQGPLFEAATITAELGIFTSPPPSFYRQYGEWFAWVLVIVSALFCLGFEYKRR